jgi:phenylacetate-CoA ligase
MTLTEIIRNKLFWLVDFIKKSPIKSQLNEINFSFIEKNSNPSYATNKLNNILLEACSNTEFYKEFNGFPISQFPVIDKNLIRENYEKFLSRKYSESERIPLITSGSTGTPFITYQNKEKRQRNTADTIFMAQLGGYFVGKKLYYFKIWSEYNKKSEFLRFMQNIIAVDVLNLKKNLPNVFKNLQANQSPIAILGYVSALETLSKFLDNENGKVKKPSVCSIITMSESLDEYTKTRLEEHLKCPVLSRYSNIENGILAQQTIKDPINFTVNIASYYIEILDVETNEVLPFGKLGKIVVTDYFNKAMPLIRYDTGDTGIMNEVIIDNKKTLVLSHIEGRKLDRIYNTKGELISSYIVYKNMWSYPEIEQYQFIQVSNKDYTFKISMKDKFEREVELTNEFKVYLGEDANFKIEYVKEIPLLNSGKRKKVMNISAQNV